MYQPINQRTQKGDFGLIGCIRFTLTENGRGFKKKIDLKSCHTQSHAEIIFNIKETLKKRPKCKIHS